MERPNQHYSKSHRYVPYSEIQSRRNRNVDEQSRRNRNIDEQSRRNRNEDEQPEEDIPFQEMFGFDISLKPGKNDTVVIPLFRRSRRNRNEDEQSRRNRNVDEQSRRNRNIDEQSRRNRNVDDQSHRYRNVDDQSHRYRNVDEQPEEDIPFQEMFGFDISLKPGKNDTVVIPLFRRSRRNRNEDEQSRRNRNADEQSRRNRNVNEQSRRNRNVDEQSRRNRNIDEQSRRNRNVDEQSRRNRNIDEQSRRNRNVYDQSHRYRNVDDQSHRYRNVDEQPEEDIPFQEMFGFDISLKPGKNDTVVIPLFRRSRRNRNEDEQSRRNRNADEHSRRNRNVNEQSRRNRNVDEQSRRNRNIDEQSRRNRNVDDQSHRYRNVDEQPEEDIPFQEMFGFDISLKPGKNDTVVIPLFRRNNTEMCAKRNIYMEKDTEKKKIRTTPMLEDRPRSNQSRKFPPNVISLGDEIKRKTKKDKSPRGSDPTHRSEELNRLAHGSVYGNFMTNKESWTPERSSKEESQSTDHLDWLEIVRSMRRARFAKSPIFKL